jgi:hypothetical protein
VLSEARHVAPGRINPDFSRALKERVNRVQMEVHPAPSALLSVLPNSGTRGDVLRFAQHLPLAITFRAFGAPNAFAC